jgi:hypothetical protein
VTYHPDDAHITHDPAYKVVAPDDFPAMIEVDRYELRSDAFDGIIGQTHDHFWDPFNPAYLDFATPFDVDREYIMPPERVPELNCAVKDRLDEGQQIRLSNNITRFRMSGILHGEQGALSLSASLCDILLDPGAQEYAANQAREEARHVAGFGRYIKARWGKPYPCSAELGRFLNEIVLSPIVYKKLVGMQLMLEGLAMGAFADTYAYTRDPLLKRLIQLVMTDEAFHHKFGKIWADRTIPKLTPDEHDKVEDWAAHVFESLLFNLTSISQRTYIYEELGLDWQWVRDAVREAYGRDSRRNSMQESTNLFRVLIKTLLNAGIITDRTKHVYSPWVNLGELADEGDSMLGEAVAADGIEYLREINRKRRGNALRPAAAA